MKNLLKVVAIYAAAGAGCMIGYLVGNDVYEVAKDYVSDKLEARKAKTK